MTCLVDSTVFISWMRSGRNPIRILAPWIHTGSLVGCGIVRAEVLRGMVALPARQEMTLLFDHIPDVPLAVDGWSDVAELAWELDRDGKVLPLTDVAIAICARRSHATLVTRDRHFQAIPGIALLSDLPNHL
jgi:predicted nucleic acid-binding protein